MDIISHGLWGGITLGRKSRKSFWTAFAFGTLPDFLSFGILFIFVIFGLSQKPIFSSGTPPDPSAIPHYVNYLYNITHSLVVFFIVFGLLWLITRKPVWESCAWGLHILFDIFTHTTQFFPTPFLWPISGFRVNGTSWADPSIFIPNITFIIIVYAVFFFAKHRKNKNVI